MAIHYSYEQLLELWNNEIFLRDFEKYKIDNQEKIDKLLNHIKNQNKISFNLSNDSKRIKTLNNILNKINESNIDLCIKDLYKLNIDRELYNIIIDKSIIDIQHMDTYIKLLIEFNINIIDILNEKIETLFEIETYDNDISDYEKLCLINRKIDKSCGLCILISKLESNNIIQNYIINVINKFFIHINTDDNDICDRYINSLYSIFKHVDKRIIVLYIGKLEDLSKKNISTKNKFKIMDILDLKN